MSKEPGELLFSTFNEGRAPLYAWSSLSKSKKRRWARSESAIRADERAKAIEECAKVAEDHVWARDVEWWLHATKKEVSEVSACEVAAALRAKIGAEHG